MLKLLGLLGVLEDEGVEVALAADLELDLRRLLVLLYSGRGSILASADLNELCHLSACVCAHFLLRRVRPLSSSNDDFKSSNIPVRAIADGRTMFVAVEIRP